MTLFRDYLKYLHDNAPESLVTIDWRDWYTPKGFALYVKRMAGVHLPRQEGERVRWLLLGSEVIYVELNAGHSYCYLRTPSGVSEIIFWCKPRSLVGAVTVKE